MDAADAAERFASLFPAIYERLHARAAKSDALTPQSWALLQHLALAGPLTVGECALHFGRAQSVVSETVDALERRGLLERMRDARDRRRTLVWLTDAAHEQMSRARRVLDDERLGAAMKKLTPQKRAALIEAMTALVRAAERERRPREKEKE